MQVCNSWPKDSPTAPSKQLGESQDAMQSCNVEASSTVLLMSGEDGELPMLATIRDGASEVSLCDQKRRNVVCRVSKGNLARPSADVTQKISRF